MFGSLLEYVRSARFRQLLDAWSFDFNRHLLFELLLYQFDFPSILVAVSGFFCLGESVDVLIKVTPLLNHLLHDLVLRLSLLPSIVASKVVMLFDRWLLLHSYSLAELIEFKYYIRLKFS